jgi:recombination protein RecA
MVVAVKSSREARQVIQSVAGIFAGRFARPALPTAFNYRPAVDISMLSTGFRSLDKALGIGGLPAGKITELMGPGPLASSGALVVAAGIGAKVQRKQRIVTIIDLSRHFDSWQAERCGLIAPQLLLAQPQTVFDTLTTLEGVSHQEGLVIVVLGVVADLLDHAEPGILKTLLGRLCSIVRQSQSACLFITSSLDDNPFSPTNYPAGFPLAEVADVRLWIQAETWTHKDGLTTAYKASLTVVRNQLAIAGTGADIRIAMTR